MFQLVIGSPELVRARLAVKPVFQELAVYATAHPAAALADPIEVSVTPVPTNAAAAAAATTRYGRRCAAPRFNLIMRFSRCFCLPLGDCRGGTDGSSTARSSQVLDAAR